MIEIACPSCSAQYPLDERRVPPKGSNMRCPRCGTSFRVFPDGNVEAAPETASVPAPTAPKAKTFAAPVQDLPAAGGAPRGLFGDSPAPKPKAPLAPPMEVTAPSETVSAKSPRLDLDLPAPPSARVSSGGMSFGELDLPAPPEPKAALADSSRTPFDDLDLDLPAAPGASGNSPSNRPSFGDLDLPAPPGMGNPRGAGMRDSFGDLDLPAPRSFGAPNADLPAAPSSDFGAIDLPASPKSPDAPTLDLPAPGGAGAGGVGLPAAARTPGGQNDFGDLDLPMPRAPVSNPGSAQFGDLDLPEPKVAGRASDGFGDLDLPEPNPSYVSSSSIPPGADSELENPAMAATQMAKPPPLPGAGGTAFGELELGMGDPHTDDMEFADIPEANEAEVMAAPVNRPSVAQRTAPQVKVKRSPMLLVVLFLLVLLVGGGAALGMTPLGYFGIYFFEGFLPGAGDDAQVGRVIAQVEETSRDDTYAALTASVVTLGEARYDAGLNRRLLLRSMLHESLYKLRFGRAAGATSHVNTIRLRLQERGVDNDVEGELAFAADALASEQIASVMSRLSRARAHAPQDPYVELVEGELALINEDTAQAEAAFSAAVEKGAGARGLWGIARSLASGEDRDAFAEALDRVIEASPGHGAALSARAELYFEAEDSERALAMANQAAGRARVGERYRWTEPTARAEALTLVGRIYESQGRVSQALEVYRAAQEVDDNHPEALLGAARVLLLDRPEDAMARFEAVMAAADSASTVLANGRTASAEARLGSARALLELSRVQEAHDRLETLALENEADAEVLLWLGRSEEALDEPNHEAAEQHFRAAITHAPERFDAYLALAELFYDMGQTSQARVTIEQALTRVPETAEMRYQLGHFELRRNRNVDAIRELRRAFELNNRYPQALFDLAIAHRREGQLDEAARVFDQLGAMDPNYPGMALQRGLLFESRGDSAQAVAAYQRALEEQPDDPDLLLRLGAAQVTSGDIDDAEQTLERVRDARPNSAEAEHFVGRVKFARGNYGEALSHFREAVRLDPDQAEFHFYTGWAALEGNQLGEALREVNRAVEVDPSLGDAYWIRGEIRLRTGRPAEALEDLRRAIQLRPNRYEALAAMGDALDQASQLPEAIEAYEQAVAGVDDNGKWYWRLGQLRMDHGDSTQAAEALARATLFGDAMSPMPSWLPDAHRLRGEALRLRGNRAEAIVHYQRYLEIASRNALDRPDVRRRLMDYGVVPN